LVKQSIGGFLGVTGFLLSLGYGADLSILSFEGKPGHRADVGVNTFRFAILR
jgi:hypothetical protein